MKEVYYVYRLIDPRDGQTFYVGKGKDNRIFSHIYDEQISQESDIASDKIQRIRDIKASGLDVLHVIHRHALDEQTAFEVEGALIDAYLGLSNIQNGSGNSENGVMHVHEINQKYAAEEAEIILAVAQGIIRGAYVNATWLAATKSNFSDHLIQASDAKRWGFEADEAPIEIRNLYVGKKIPSQYERKKGEISPVKYTY